MSSQADSRKLDAARRQLGTALSLFIDDLDPVSVHCLACGGAELAEHLAKKSGASAFVDHAMKVDPSLDERTLARLRNRYWNAFKHAKAHDGSERADDVLLDGFSDEQNDHTLLVGWLDLAEAMGGMPIEAQVFQCWYFALHPEKLSAEFNTDAILRVFPNLSALGRNEGKAELRRVIEFWKTNEEIMGDPKTDRRPLVLP